ncbi:NUDIX hydrolase [Peribacillus frigoritolerans]|uniref:NUDIX hydrolase n=1 Tax=Peribacillus frigoritolerans TaxID=450367 RepID=UPI0024BF0A2D|nr:8-oxo-dGTP diphosphatase [Peribacillus frigoritolerans]
MFKYTVCFVKKNNELLMLNREKAPIMGVWNGVGGKIEKGETPDMGAHREVFEETGIEVESHFSKGTVTWETPEGELDGIYVYWYMADEDLIYETPKKTREGILDWRSIDWILHPLNLVIAEMVSQYLPVLLKKEGNYTFTYKNGYLTLFET